MNTNVKNDAFEAHAKSNNNCHSRTPERSDKVPLGYKRGYGVLLQKTISPIEHFGDDKEFCKSLLYLLIYSLLSWDFKSWSFLSIAFPSRSSGTS